MTIALPVLAALAVVAGSDEPLVLTCTSPIPADASAQTLAATFGKANVRSDAARRRRRDGARHGALPERSKATARDLVERHQASTPPATIAVSDKSQWKVGIPHLTPLLLGVDASLSDVEEANGRPFKVAGFAWDYGGYPDFTGGKLDGKKKGCGVVLRFSPDDHAKEADIDKVSGESTFSSRNPALRKVRPYVSAIDLSP